MPNFSLYGDEAFRSITWPNKLGCDVRAGRLLLEVWDHGGVTRVVPDNSGGCYGTHHTRVAKGTFEQMAAEAVFAWKNRRNTWEECT